MKYCIASRCTFNRIEISLKLIESTQILMSYHLHIDVVLLGCICILEYSIQCVVNE